MSDEQPPSTGPMPEEEIPVVGPILKKTTRFSREVVATMIALASAAFGVVAALAWNEAITALFRRLFGEKGTIGALFVYAAIITLIGVLVIVFLGRLAARLSAEPVEFKYPGGPRR